MKDISNLIDNKCMGILGGMGFRATIIFQEQFLKLWNKNYNIKKEYDYPNYICFTNTHLPSRTRHIFLNDESPLLQLKKDIIKLNNMGATFIIIPCNTVHYYYDELQKVSNCKILNIIEITSNYLIKKKYKNFNILGSEALIKEKLYCKYKLTDIIYVKDLEKSRCIIDAIKHGNIYDKILDDFKSILSKDRTNILGCTEFSVLYKKYKDKLKEYKIEDAMLITIEYIVKNFNYIN